VLDVFYDHALARNWLSYCGMPLDDFIRDFYGRWLKIVRCFQIGWPKSCR